MSLLSTVQNSTFHYANDTASNFPHALNHRSLFTSQPIRFHVKDLTNCQGYHLDMKHYFPENVCEKHIGLMV